MTLQTLAWLAMAAYALHIAEEFAFDWRNWARAVIKLPVEWSDFYVTNAIVIALGIAQAQLRPGSAVGTTDVRFIDVDQRVVPPHPALRANEGTLLAGPCNGNPALFARRNSCLAESRARGFAGLDHGSARGCRRSGFDGLSHNHAEP
jgi:hypothetical protein